MNGYKKKKLGEGECERRIQHMPQTTEPELWTYCSSFWKGHLWSICRRFFSAM